MHDRPLPNDLSLEREVIGIILTMASEPERQRGTLRLLAPGDFFHGDHRAAVGAALGLAAEGRPTDMAAIYKAVKLESLDLVGMMESVATTAGVEFKIADLKTMAAQRAAIYKTDKLINELHDHPAPLELIRRTAAELEDTAAAADVNAAKSYDISKIKSSLPREGFSSGFLTHDYNDSGFKKGGLTLLTGFRGDGKTTIARQFGLAVAMQKVGVFFFAGEGGAPREKASWAKLCAAPGEVAMHENRAGRRIYAGSEAAEARFDRLARGVIHMADLNVRSGKKRLFDTVYNVMAKLRQENDVRLHILDSMTVLNEGDDKKEFSEQKRIIAELKGFAVTTNSHVLLLCHQAKDQTRVSGRSYQEDLADSVLRYVRVKAGADKQIDMCIKRLPLPDKERAEVSALLLNEKVRDEGTQIAAPLVWDGKRGACIEVSPAAKALEYETAGYWVRHVERFADVKAAEPDTSRLPYKD